MELAAGLRLPLVTVIDTPGGELSPAAEEGGVAREIARCLATLITLPVPTVAILLGQGTGGAALALLPADRVLAARARVARPARPRRRQRDRFQGHRARAGTRRAPGHPRRRPGRRTASWTTSSPNAPTASCWPASAACWRRNCGPWPPARTVPGWPSASAGTGSWDCRTRIDLSRSSGRCRARASSHPARWRRTAPPAAPASRAGNALAGPPPRGRPVPGAAGRS